MKNKAKHKIRKKEKESKSETMRNNEDACLAEISQKQQGTTPTIMQYKILSDDDHHHDDNLDDHHRHDHDHVQHDDHHYLDQPDHHLGYDASMEMFTII